MNGIRTPSYELIKGGRYGRLLEDFVFQDSIRGFRVDYDLDAFRCILSDDGVLTVYRGSEWDFGSWAIDTPAMVYASLEHDSICNMTNTRDLPWSCRKEGDARFRKRLEEAGGTEWRWFRWVGVSLYSQLIARWKDKR